MLIIIIQPHIKRTNSPLNRPLCKQRGRTDHLYSMGTGKGFDTPKLTFYHRVTWPLCPIRMAKLKLKYFALQNNLWVVCLVWDFLKNEIVFKVIIYYLLFIVLLGVTCIGIQEDWRRIWGWASWRVCCVACWSNDCFCWSSLHSQCPSCLKSFTLFTPFYNSSSCFSSWLSFPLLLTFSFSTNSSFFIQSLIVR